MKYLATAILIVTLGATICADDFDDLVERAKAGDSVAQYEVGMAYAEGEVVEKDCNLAEQWIRRAAENNHQRAQLRLARMFDIVNGGGLYGNLCSHLLRFGNDRGAYHREASKWYRRAAEQGGREAVGEFVWNCMTGGGCAEGELLEVMTKAAEMGYGELQGHLGNYYVMAAADTVSAYVWLVLSEASGERSDGLNPDNVAKHMDPNDLAQAQFFLGERYANGKGVEQDYLQAEEWYHRAAVQGHTMAQLALAFLYDGDIGGPIGGDSDLRHKTSYEPNPETWYRLAAESGSPDMQYALADYYIRGHGNRREDLIEILIKAAEQGHGSAMGELSGIRFMGFPYVDTIAAYVWAVLWQASKYPGDGLPPEQISRWMDIDDLAEAQFRIAERYYDGRAVEQGVCIAETWYRKSAENGHMKAQLTMARLFDPQCGSEIYARCIDNAPLDRNNRTAWFVEANRWYHKARRHGTLEALVAYSEHCLSGGKCLEMELMDALTKAAEWGHVESQYNLARHLENLALDKNRASDRIQVLMWYEIAANAGHPIASLLRDATVESETVTLEQIAEAKRLAREWIEAHPAIDSANATPDITR